MTSEIVLTMSALLAIFLIYVVNDTREIAEASERRRQMYSCATLNGAPSGLKGWEYDIVCRGAQCVAIVGDVAFPFTFDDKGCALP